MTGLRKLHAVALPALLVLALWAVEGTSGTIALARGIPVQFASHGVMDTLFDPTTPPGIDQGDVIPAGKSGRFVVKDRTVTGTLSALLPGSPEGRFSFTYGTNVPLLTQSGQIHGTLSIAGGLEAKVRAESALLGYSPEGLPVIGITGRLTFTSGAQGTGDIQGVIVPVLDPATLHIIGLAYGEVGIAGRWQQ
ncbi:MAG: hypothetical protein FJ313_03015 [Gemmatimonadetes bacterium]|nr:hypothetical protein [Gemmatimonadota bacterium]